MHSATPAVLNPHTSQFGVQGDALQSGAEQLAGALGFAAHNSLI